MMNFDLYYFVRQAKFNILKKSTFLKHEQHNNNVCNCICKSFDLFTIECSFCCCCCCNKSSYKIYVKHTVNRNIDYIIDELNDCCCVIFIVFLFFYKLCGNYTISHIVTDTLYIALFNAC